MSKLNLENGSGGLVKEDSDVLVKDNLVLLSPRTYLGSGYFHYFMNNTNGDMVLQSCTQAEYQALGATGGSANNPTMSGHTWVYSANGAINVDSESGLLEEDEYCTIGAEKFIRKTHAQGYTYYLAVPSSAVDANHNIDADVYPV